MRLGFNVSFDWLILTRDCECDQNLKRKNETSEVMLTLSLHYESK